MFHPSIMQSCQAFQTAAYAERSCQNFHCESSAHRATLLAIGPARPSFHCLFGPWQFRKQSKRALNFLKALELRAMSTQEPPLKDFPGRN